MIITINRFGLDWPVIITGQTQIWNTSARGWVNRAIPSKLARALMSITPQKEALGNLVLEEARKLLIQANSLTLYNTYRGALLEHNGEGIYIDDGGFYLTNSVLLSYWADVDGDHADAWRAIGKEGDPRDTLLKFPMHTSPGTFKSQDFVEPINFFDLKGEALTPIPLSEKKTPEEIVEKSLLDPKIGQLTLFCNHGEIYNAMRLPVKFKASPKVDAPWITINHGEAPKNPDLLKHPNYIKAKFETVCKGVYPDNTYRGEVIEKGIKASRAMKTVERQYSGEDLPYAKVEEDVQWWFSQNNSEDDIEQTNVPFKNFINRILKNDDSFTGITQQVSEMFSKVENLDFEVYLKEPPKEYKAGKVPYETPRTSRLTVIDQLYKLGRLKITNVANSHLCYPDGTPMPIQRITLHGSDGKPCSAYSSIGHADSKENPSSIGRAIIGLPRFHAPSRTWMTFSQYFEAYFIELDRIQKDFVVKEGRHFGTPSRYKNKGGAHDFKDYPRVASSLGDRLSKFFGKHCRYIQGKIDPLSGEVILQPEDLEVARKCVNIVWGKVRNHPEWMIQVWNSHLKGLLCGGIKKLSEATLVGLAQESGHVVGSDPLLPVARTGKMLSQLISAPPAKMMTVAIMEMDLSVQALITPEGLKNLPEASTFMWSKSAKPTEIHTKGIVHMDWVGNTCLTWIAPPQAKTKNLKVISPTGLKCQTRIMHDCWIKNGPAVHLVWPYQDINDKGLAEYCLQHGKWDSVVICGKEYRCLVVQIPFTVSPDPGESLPTKHRDKWRIEGFEQLGIMKTIIERGIPEVITVYDGKEEKRVRQWKKGDPVAYQAALALIETYARLKDITLEDEYSKDPEGQAKLDNLLNELANKEAQKESLETKKVSTAPHVSQDADSQVSEVLV